MNELRQYGPRDERSNADGDEYFIGVDERLAPMQLPPGTVSRGKNVRFRDGKAATRLGIQICPWMKGDGRTPWSEVYGGAVFSDPNQTEEWFLIAADGGVWKTRPNMVATQVPLPAEVTLTAATFAQFVQCFNVIVLLRGEDEPPLVCSNLDEGFKYIVQTSGALAAGLRTIPNSRYGLSYLNRALLIDGKDRVAASDFQDYTGYLPLQNTFRINEGNVDRLVAIQAFDKSTLIMFKEQSILQVTEAKGSLSTAALENVTDKYGCDAPRSIAKSGKNMYWLADGQVASLQLTQLNQVQDSQQFLSDPLSKTFRRVNSQYVAGVVAEIWEGKLYVALPLDDAEIVKDYATAGGYDITGTMGFTLSVGKWYRWTMGANEIRLVNGSTTLTQGGDFLATAMDVTITGTASTDFTGTFEQVLKGTNTGVAVYDFLNQAWSGVDEADGIFAVKQFLKAKHHGKTRLFILGADGMLRLYEEGFEDEVLAEVSPYVDLLVNALPAVGNSIRVNGATPAVVIASAANAANQWGCDTLTHARANLWAGYNPATLNFDYNALDVIVTEQDWGVRFRGTHVPPTIVITGNWASVGNHEGVEVTCVPIQSEIVTRGYRCQDADRKRFLALVLLLQTWNPKYTITTIVGGVNDTKAYQTDIERDRLKYDVFDKPDWDPSNVNDDHGEPKRFDYSLTLPDTGFNCGTGVNPDLHQGSTERVPVSEMGHYLQVKLVNTQGRLELQTAMMEAQPTEHESGAHI